MPSKGMRTVFSSPSTTSSPPQSSYGSSSIPHHILAPAVINAKFEISESIILNWEQIQQASDKPFSLFDGNRTSAYQYLQSVADLQSAMHFFVAENSASEKLIRAQKLMQLAMNRLQKEFLRILSNNRSYLDPESVSNLSSRSSVSEICDDLEDEIIQAAYDSVSEPETESERTVWDLKAISDTMISSGYRKECINIYKLIRKSIIDEILYDLGVEKLTSSQIQKMEWELVEVKIKSWLRTIKIVITTIFNGEKILCERVFSASPMTAEMCFSEIVREGATSLFAFPEHLSKYKKLSPEKIFRVLDVYDVVSELWAEIESIFSYDSISTVRSQAINGLVVLGAAIRNLLSDFEAAIQKEVSKSPALNGGVHPLTRYVLNYLIFISDYSGILMDILSDFPVMAQSPMPESYFSSPVPEDHPASVISERLAWLVLVLLCKLDVKARLYNDMALSYLFLANNLNYVVSKVRTSNLKLLLGDYWILNHEKKVKQYAFNYEQIGWSRVMSSLPNPTDDISLDIVEGYFRKFNLAFDEACRKQSSWVVPDQKLRDEIRVSVAKKLVPSYRDFYEMYRLVFPAESGREPIVRYTPDDLGHCLSDLFYGTGSVASFSSPRPSR